MSMRSRFLRPLLVCATLSTVFLTGGDSLRALSSGVVISQVYGGGGNAGAPFKNDFIELFNRGTSPVNLSGWSVQYASATGTSWSVTNLTNVTLAPGQYYLVQEAAGAGAVPSLPAPDVTGTIPMSATAGKVALVSNTTALTGIGCPFVGTIVDFVGFGTANCSETAPTPTLANATAAIRAVHGCTEIDNNSTDFSTGTPTPRNTATAADPCSGDSAPSVTSTTPATGATNVSVNSTIVINFSESVTASATAFSLVCPAGTPQAFTQTASPATTFTLTPASPLPAGTACAVTVTAAQVTDTDSTDPPDAMAAAFNFSFTTANPVDVAPAVTSTTPANGASNINVDSNIAVSFSESVAASIASFNIQCGSLQSFTLSASPGSSFTLDPVAALPYSTNCTVTAIAANIADTDTNDPPDNPAADFSFSFRTADAPPPGAANVIINETDADTPGDDAAEFVELYDGGTGGLLGTALDGLTVVFFAGEDHLAYAAFDLDGYRTNADGYFTLGNPGVPGAGLTFAPGQFGLLQNGADAVALYVGNAADFFVANPDPLQPALVRAPVTTSGLLDAIVYDTDDADDATLLALLNAGQPQVNENFFGLKVDQSLQRCTNGSGGQRNTSTYLPATPTPNAPATCTPLAPRPASDIVVSQLYGGGGNSGAPYTNDFVELYNRGAATVDITGWSLQYASSTGSGWDFNKTPLGGAIGPGEYYLIALASGGANGAALPAANVSGLINMSGTTGKIALVDNYDALVTNCPTWNVHVKDFVGYGTADCREGATNAPAPSNTKAIYRNNAGVTDTDVNGADFAVANPLPRRTAPIVELGPNVVGSDPANNATSAPRDATIQVTFTELVDVVDPWFNISCITSGLHTSATQAGSGQSRYLTPNDNFTAGEQCTVTVFKDQVRDQDADDSAPFSDTMPANYVWSFTVASGTAPPYEASVHLAMGNPSGAVANVSQFDNYLMEKPEFTLSYNRDLGRPNWVSSHLSDEWFGTLARVDTFRADPAVPADWYRVQSFDFSGSGFDRGHMVPNADRDKETSIPINQATFLMSNMIAQAPGNNQGPWAALEGDLRTLAGSTNELYVVTGPAGVGGSGSNGGTTMTLAAGNVTVPDKTWKVALVLAKGINDVSRVTCSTRTIAVIMPNDDNIRPNPWTNYLTTVDAVEELTGYDFFSNLPQSIQACVEARKDGDPAIPLDNLAPSVNCASPDGNWQASNVSLLCTATDSGSGLANAGDVSFSLFTSVGIAEDANASTGSRLVCDVAGNCTTAGPIAGNKIDQKDPDITITAPADGAVYHQNEVVTAAYSCTDGGSGLGSCTGTVADLAALDTAGFGPKTFVVNAADAVGNTSTRTVTYTIDDTVGPTVVCAPADSNWQGDNVVFACTASDGGSGLANSADASFSLVTSVVDDIEDANATSDLRSVCDAALNCTQAGPITGNKIDRRDPDITLTAPVNGAVYQQNQVVNADFSCTDGGSGLGTCTGTVANSAAIDTASAGSQSFVVTATDAVGNTSSRSVTYSVGDSVAPSVVCAAADSAWHAGNVAIACTASDGGSGLANAADAGFSLVTAVADDTADTNAASDFRSVCDVAGNCTQAGPIAGNKVDRKDPTITLTTPTSGAVYQLNKIVNAGYGCADTGSGLATCAGNVASLAPIDTASLGTKTFVVTAVDAVGNTASTTVTYTVAAATISISNIPVSAFVGSSFVPAFNYQGDGATSVTSLTPGRCTVTGGTVTFLHKGTCRLVAHASATANFDAANGAAQEFTITKQTPTVSISNIPGAAINGGSFTPTFAYTGDGNTRARSETPETCRVHQDEVRFVNAGTCTLTARASGTPLDAHVVGSPQSFVIGPATPTIEITNIPAKPKVGKSFVPNFRYDGDGVTTVTSSTATCAVVGNAVQFVSAGTCTLTARATATNNYTAATGLPESFLVKVSW